MIYLTKTKNKKFSGRHYKLTSGPWVDGAFSLTFGFKAQMEWQWLTWPPVNHSSRMNVWANFALGSTSSQLQEVLVTDLPRSFHSGKRETREGWGKEMEDRVFNFHCSTEVTPAAVDFRRRSYKTMSHKQAFLKFTSCGPLVSPPICFALIAEGDCRSQSHIPMTFIQC